MERSGCFLLDNDLIAFDVKQIVKLGHVTRLNLEEPSIAERRIVDCLRRVLEQLVDGDDVTADR